MNHPYLSSQLAADRHASRLAEASRQRLVREACAVRKAAIPARQARPVRSPIRLRLPVWLRRSLPA